jgi:hypothetical protein
MKKMGIEALYRCPNSSRRNQAHRPRRLAAGCGLLQFIAAKDRGLTWQRSTYSH